MDLLQEDVGELTDTPVELGISSGRAMVCHFSINPLHLDQPVWWETADSRQDLVKANEMGIPN